MSLARKISNNTNEPDSHSCKDSTLPTDMLRSNLLLENWTISSWIVIIMEKTLAERQFGRNIDRTVISCPSIL